MEPFTLFDHQKTGVTWLLGRENNPIVLHGATIRGGCLFDDMGLGKTVQMKAMCYRNPKPRTLAVVLKSCIAQWAEELLSIGLAAVYEYMGHDHYRRIEKKDNGLHFYPQALSAHVHWPAAPYMVLTTYNRVGAPLATTPWDRIILDEAHAIKNMNKAYTACIALRVTLTGTRWVCTGTPIQNRVRDLAALLNFLGIPDAHKLATPALQTIWQALVLRRTKAALEDDARAVMQLPNHLFKYQVDIKYETEEEADFYRAASGQLMTQFARLQRYYSVNFSHSALAISHQLRQLGIHPNVYIRGQNKRRVRLHQAVIPEWVGSASKLKSILDVARKIRLKSSCPNIVVFTQYREEMMLLEQEFRANDFCVLTISGSMSTIDRERTLAESRRLVQLNGNSWWLSFLYTQAVFCPEIAAQIASFACPRKPVILILQILAGGTGLNLQHFSHVMFPSPHWNPTLEDQAICRCYRIGQKNSVRVYSFCLSEVVGCVRQIDHEIMSRQQSKRGIIATFMESGSDTRMVPVDAGMEATIEGDDEALTASQLPI